jgi:spore germination cell wall hydrolase CwlJ-like protein
MVTATDLATQIKYGPVAGKSIKRSQYLAQALQAMQEQSQKIQSPFELAARLGAAALLTRGQNKADDEMMGAVAADRKARADGALAGLPDYSTPTPPPPQTPELAAPTQATPPPPAPVTSAPLPAAAPARQYSPADRMALAQMITGEAGGEGPQGMIAAGAVAMNRLNKGGYGQTLADVINAPHQFEAMRRPKAPTPEAQAIADQLLAGTASDPTGGAVNYLNPELQASLGRQQPSWAPPGQGQRIGRHVFYGGTPPAPGSATMDTMGNPVPPPPAPPQTIDQAGPIADQPFQVAAAGGLQPGMLPSPPVSPGAGAPPAAPTSPQAGAAGGPHRVTADEVALAKRLLADPQTYEQGLAYAFELQKKEAAPTKFDTTTVNGVPAWNDPYNPGRTVMGSVPQGAMSQVVPATSYNPTAPQGVMAVRDPLGNLKEAPGGPPSGFSAQPGGGLQYQPGGPQDPYRPQAPASGYEYAGGVQRPIQGGPQDPRSPQNILSGTEGLRKEIQPVVDAAIKLRRNIQAVRVGVAQNNGAGDIAAINGIQRLIDDGVVREGDVALQLKAQGIDGGIAGVQAFLQSTGTFSPEIRQKIAATANQLYDGINSTFRDRVAGYKPIVDRAYGDGTFEQYVFPTSSAQSLGWAAQPPGGAPGAPGAPPAPNPALVAPSSPQDTALALLIKRGVPLSAQMQKRARELGLMK